MLIAPVASSAAGLVPPCDSTSVPGQCTWGFVEFMKLINNVIGFILFDLALPIAALMFFYAGFLMVTSAGSSESKSKAKNIFSNAVFGLVIAAGAWLIVKTILSVLGFKGAWIFNGF